MVRRRSYQQFCGVARGLDRVGERWTLLIVRNLLLGPRRYSDLLEELPGITTNLLAKRLREIEAEGLIIKRDLPPPGRATVYDLTEMGAALEPVILELGRWGWRFLQGGPRRDDTTNIAWGLLSLKRRYQGREGDGSDQIVAFRVGSRHFELGLGDGYLSVKERQAVRPALTIEGTEEAFRGWLFAGKVASGKGALRFIGSRETLQAVTAAFEPRLPVAGLVQAAAPL